MIKRLKAWIASRKRARRLADYGRGYAYAAALLLEHKGARDPRHNAGYDFDFNDFDRGIDDACERYEALTGNTIGES